MSAEAVGVSTGGKFVSTGFEAELVACPPVFLLLARLSARALLFSNAFFCFLDNLALFSFPFPALKGFLPLFSESSTGFPVSTDCLSDCSSDSKSWISLGCATAAAADARLRLEDDATIGVGCAMSD